MVCFLIVSLLIGSIALFFLIAQNFPFFAKYRGTAASIPRPVNFPPVKSSAVNPQPQSKELRREQQQLQTVCQQIIQRKTIGKNGEKLNEVSEKLAAALEMNNANVKQTLISAAQQQGLTIDTTPRSTDSSSSLPPSSSPTLSTRAHSMTTPTAAAMTTPKRMNGSTTPHSIHKLQRHTSTPISIDTNERVVVTTLREPGSANHRYGNTPNKQ